MLGEKNEQPFEHRSTNGCIFEADRCDFKNGVTVTPPDGISQAQLCADTAEFAAFHATNILEQLNGFCGYAAISYTFKPERL